MDRTYKCPNGHKFKSSQDSPACPRCSETASPVQWKKVEDKPSGHRKGSDRRVLKSALSITTVGVVGGLMAGSGSTDAPPADDYEGKGGDFGGGGASGTF